ncbi:MAG: radical SAM protein [Candidatus Omnitrophota bacterium]
MKTKKVVLFYPSGGCDYLEYQWMPWPVLTLATYLDHHGFEPVLIDGRTEEDVESIIRKETKDALLFGISATTGPQLPYALEGARIVRDVDPSLPILWGGWHPTIFPEQTAEHPLVDIVARGRGENLIVNLARALYDGSDLSSVEGIVYKKNGALKKTPQAPTSYPALSACSHEKYVDITRYINPKTRLFCYFTGYGCLYNCTFCSRTYMGKRYDAVEIDMVLDDIKYLTDKYDFKNLYIYDDNFFAMPKRCVAIAKGMIDRGIKLKWKADSRANVFPRYKEEDIKALVDSGLISIFIGAESGSPRMLNKLCKGVSPDHLIETAKVCSRVDIQMHLSYMFGVPGETVEDLKLTIEQVKTMRSIYDKVNVTVARFMLYPGTAIYDEMMENGFLKNEPSTLEEWGAEDRKPANTFISPPWFDKKTGDEYKKVFDDYFGESYRSQWSVKDDE